MNLLDTYYPILLHCVSFWSQYWPCAIDDVLIAFQFGHSGGKGEKFLLKDEIFRLNLDGEGTKTLIRRIIESSFRLVQKGTHDRQAEIDASWIRWKLIWMIVRHYLPDDTQIQQRVLLKAIEGEASVATGCRLEGQETHFLQDIDLGEPAGKSPQQVIDFALKVGISEEALAMNWMRMVMKRAETLKTEFCFEAWENLHIGKKDLAEECMSVRKMLFLREAQKLLIERDPVSAINEKSWMNMFDRLIPRTYRVNAGSFFATAVFGGCDKTDRIVWEKMWELVVRSYARGTVGVADYFLNRFRSNFFEGIGSPEETRTVTIRQAIKHAVEKLHRFDTAAALAKLIGDDATMFENRAVDLGQKSELVMTFLIE